ncbi:MAG: hypothetical protein AAF601_13825 [Pseudomonadota bacterium]
MSDELHISALEDVVRLRQTDLLVFSVPIALLLAQMNAFAGQSHVALKVLLSLSLIVFSVGCAVSFLRFRLAHSALVIVKLKRAQKQSTEAKQLLRQLDNLDEQTEQALLRQAGEAVIQSVRKPMNEYVPVCYLLLAITFGVAVWS